MTPPNKPIRPHKPSKPIPRVDIVRVAGPHAPVKDKTGNLDQPISPPTEPMQYRAIGLVKGRYVPSADNIVKGQLVTEDGTTIDSYVLGKLISIVKKRLDMTQPHLWVVYPRTQEKEGEAKLFLQVAGVWAPQEMGKPDQPIDPGIPDGYFSVRGEVTKVLETEGLVTVKIRRLNPVKAEKSDKADAQSGKKPKKRPYTRFKLHLWGLLPKNAVGYFWEINVQRQGTKLVIVDGKAIAPIRKFTRKPAPKAKKPPQKPVPRPHLRPRVPKPQF